MSKLDSVMRRAAQSSLTRNEVAQIRYLRFNKKLSRRALAERFNTTEGNISHIINYRTWTDVRPSNAMARGAVTPDERERILRLFKTGKDTKTIALRTTRSRRTVQRIIAGAKKP
jgi:DNA-binding NarL/FixJ family response regulator